jgi:hypothetical protein
MMSVWFVDEFDADEVQDGFHVDDPSVSLDEFDAAEEWLAAQDVPDWTA